MGFLGAIEIVLTSETCLPTVVHGFDNPVGDEGSGGELPTAALDKGSGDLKGSGPSSTNLDFFALGDCGLEGTTGVAGVIEGVTGGNIGLSGRGVERNTSGKRAVLNLSSV